ncbi:hypothetical protein [Pseudomonas shirazensis]|uniref:hypothetical protein n=1 Tax=Pseudomonas shirazensis TaxID=2745494 RepID=UPI003D28A0D5
MSNSQLSKGSPTSANQPDQAPTIDSVVDEKGSELPPDGEVTANTLTLRGQALANKTIQVLDGSTVLKTETVGADGLWISTLTGLTDKRYAFKAKGEYDANPESEIRYLTIRAICEDFTSLPIGFQFDDWVPHHFDSGLIVFPSNPNTPASVDAVIVENGSAHAISHLDSTNPPLYLDMYVTNYAYPLIRPVTVTVSFEVLYSDVKVIHLRGEYLNSAGGPEHFYSSVDNAAGSVCVTFPVGAHPYSRPEDVTGLRVFLTSHLHVSPPIPGSTRIQVNSVCWSQ